MKRSKMKLSNEAKFRLAVHTALLAGVSTAVMPVSAQQAAADEKATELEAVEVTGSRLGRADIEGALPIATISREDIDRSGFTSVAELLRNTTFNSLGAFRAQSGSSAQGLVAVDLRGLGSERTLVLIDGRRAPKAPYAPSAQDLNAVPIAMVERIEVLKDGASAIYGSDAIAGVINIITRKDYVGASMSYQKQGTDRIGGDSHGGQLVAGLTGDRGSVVMGASFFSRDIIFARNSLYNTRGASSFSNNFTLTNFTDANGDGFDDVDNARRVAAVPGGCPNSDPAFYLLANGRCAYDFNVVAADEAATANQGVFVRADYKINDDWGFDLNSSVTRATSFGRYAPSLNDNPITIPAGTPNNPYSQDVTIRHRFAGLGTRDNNTDANVYDLSGALSGSIGDLSVNVGARHNEYQFYEAGKNYVVLPIASQYIIDGTYDIFDPSVNNTADVLNAMKATITRDSIWRTMEYFAEATLPLFQMTGGSAATAFGVEYRSERYFDQYDSLQEAGQIGGTAGNSSGTNRKIKSVYAEFFMPILDNLEATVSGRYEEYNDVGNNFAPKLSTRYQPIDPVTVRASIGQGFRAPTLDVISALPTYSAESINNDQATCVWDGGTFNTTTQTCSIQSQVNTTIISNPQLEAESSDQYSFGVAVDITDDIDVSLDYYNISLTDRINFVSPGEILDRLFSGDPIPAGLGVTREPTEGNRIVNVIAGSANEGDLDTSGLDIAFNVRFALGAFGKLESNLLGTYILDYKIDNGRDLVGDPAVPQYRATLGNSWSLAGWSVAFNGNHIADQAAAVSGGGVRAGHIPSYTTWDLQMGYTLPLLAGAEIAVGAINVFGREPSNSSAFDGRDYNFYLYDQYATQPYVKYTQKF